MKRFLIEGGRPLFGDVYVSGMKNAALPILFATILVKGKTVLENVPKISDITGALEILSEMGAEVAWVSPSTVEICTDSLVCGRSSRELVGTMRASTYLLGAELGRSGESKMGTPGGCGFDKRPLGFHFKGFERMGATVEASGEEICVRAPNGLHGAQIFFDKETVGGTVNCILAAVFASGVTTLSNAAKEPHIVDLSNFLNHCGADIRGAGTPMIRIHGVSELRGCTYRILPDMIEAGTFMAAVAAAGGRVTVYDLIPKHMESVSSKLSEMGVSLDIRSSAITVTSDGSLSPVAIHTGPYPGFPTDMQPQLAVLCAMAKTNGISTINESVWAGRFQYTEELRKMGAHVIWEQGRSEATFIGVGSLNGTSVRALDLRAGAAMILAGLAARGRTEVVDSGLYIDRGYFNFAGKLRGIGADIRVE